MKIYKITKGNFALENTRDIRPHENNLRFYIETITNSFSLTVTPTAPLIAVSPYIGK